VLPVLFGDVGANYAFNIWPVATATDSAEPEKFPCCECSSMLAQPSTTPATCLNCVAQ